MNLSDHVARLECARLRLGSALLEMQHLAERYREASTQMELAYTDLCGVMFDLRPASPCAQCGFKPIDPSE
jgi:hypothetical protein